MAPQNTEKYITETECEFLSEAEAEETNTPHGTIVWHNIFFFLLLHLGALYGLCCIPYAHYLTWVFAILLHTYGLLSITAGAHRLWSHRAYKARLPLRIFFAVGNVIAYQNDIIEWSRDHRVHHKFSETDADPHNAKRGFFFSHIGWLMCRKRPEVIAKGKTLDYSDLYADPVCAIQRKVYIPAVILLCFAMPAVVPWYLWGEDATNAFFICSMFRYIFTLNITFLVNSAAHMFGNKPYDQFINPVENPFVTLSAFGEGYHNYHHTFPSDYSTSEFGWKLNLSTFFIDFMAVIGQAYDRKKMDHAAVATRKHRTGDGTAGFGYFQSLKKLC